jgi:hypothetical protein
MGVWTKSKWPYATRMQHAKRLSRNARLRKDHGMLYKMSFTLSRDSERILRHRSYHGGGVTGMSRSAVLERIIQRWDILTDRMMPALSRKEWEMLRTIIGRGPFPDSVAGILDQMVEDKLRRQPMHASARGISVQDFLSKIRAMSYAERVCIVDGLERPIDNRSGVPLTYADEKAKGDAG